MWTDKLVCRRFKEVMKSQSNVQVEVKYTIILYNGKPKDERPLWTSVAGKTKNLPEEINLQHSLHSEKGSKYVEQSIEEYTDC